MPGADEFCTRNPHHERTKVFGSQKRTLDTPIGADKETHRPDTIHFSWPRLAKRITRACATTLPTIVEELETSAEKVQPSSPRGTNIHRVIAVLW